MIALKEILRHYLAEHDAAHTERMLKLQFVSCTECHTQFAEGVRFCGRCGNDSFEPASTKFITDLKCPCRNCGEVRILLQMAEKLGFDGAVPWILPGRSRLTVAIHTEKLIEMVPSGQLDNPEIMSQWFNQVVEDVRRAYAQMGPTDAFVHTDALAVTWVFEPDNQEVELVDGNGAPIL